MSTSAQQDSNANQVGVANGEVQPKSANGTLLFKQGNTSWNFFKSIRIRGLERNEFKRTTAKSMQKYAYKKRLASFFMRTYNVWYVEWVEDGVERDGKLLKWVKDPGVHKYKLFEMEEVSEKKLTGKVSRSKAGRNALQKSGDILYVVEGSKVYYCYVKLYKSLKKYDKQWYKNRWYMEERNREKTADRIEFESFVEKLANEKYKEIFPQDKVGKVTKFYRFILTPSI